jgi:hypothetical protein
MPDEPALYYTADEDEPVQLVAVHPLRWHERQDPTNFLCNVSACDDLDALHAMRRLLVLVVVVIL